jgi:hypothetical protein
LENLLGLQSGIFIEAIVQNHSGKARDFRAKNAATS